MLDIDNFKQVNDTYGHQQGDNVIKGLANILHYKQADGMHNISAGRWGGEEFMMLLPGSGASSAVRLAELIFHRNSKLCRPDFIGVMLHPARFGKILGKFFLRHAAHLSLFIKENTAVACRSGVQRHNVFCHFYTSCLFLK